MTEEPDIHAAERVGQPFMTWADETPAQRLAGRLRANILKARPLRGPTHPKSGSPPRHRRQIPPCSRK
jgi:hypothetical protein